MDVFHRLIEYEDLACIGNCCEHEFECDTDCAETSERSVWGDNNEI